MSNALLPFGIRPPLVCYNTPNRARLILDSSPSEGSGATAYSMSRKKKGKKQPKSKKIRLVKGRLQIRVQGYSGVQRIPSSHLIRYIPTSRLRVAAKKVLKQTGGSGSSKGGRGGRKKGRRKKGKKKTSKKKRKRSRKKK